MRRRCLLLLALCSLSSVACGPPTPGAASTRDTDETDGDGDGDGDPGDGDGDGEPGDGDGEPTTETDTASSTLMFVPQDDQSLDQCSCDIWAQDCPEGEKCVPNIIGDGDTWNCTRCVPVSGDLPAGEACSSNGPLEPFDDCDADSFCWNTHEADGAWVGGTCRSFCEGSPDNPMCPESSFCLITGEGSVALCVPPCDPLVQDCLVGEACSWADPAFHCLYATDATPVGQACTTIDGCAPGLICLMQAVIPECAGDACCTPFCDLLLGDGQCDAIPGTSCVSMFEQGAAPMNYEQVGVCILT